MPTITGYQQPSASGLPKHIVHNIAETVAKDVNFQPGGNLESIVKNLGGELKYQNFSGLQDSDSGSLIVHGPSKFEILIATNTSPKRDRFTIAHELGHYVLHYLYPKQAKGADLGGMVANRYGSDRTEWEANWFAAAFLMPEAEFRRIHQELSGDLDAVSEHFGVSLNAAQVRAKALKLA